MTIVAIHQCECDVCHRFVEDDSFKQHGTNICHEQGEKVFVHQIRIKDRINLVDTPLDICEDCFDELINQWLPKRDTRPKEENRKD